MCPHKHTGKLAFFICPAGLFVASVGFLLSVLATTLAVIISYWPPIIQVRSPNAASALSTSTSAQGRNTTAASRPALAKRPKVLDRNAIHAKGQGKMRAEHDEETVVLSPPIRPHIPLSPAVLPAPLQSPTQAKSSIAISPPPTRLSLSDTATDVNSDTLSSTDSHVDAPPSVSLAERRGRGRARLRLSKLVHLFGNKGRRSLPPLPSQSDADSSPLTSPKSAASIDSKSTGKPRRHSLMHRVVSCPVLHRTRSGSASVLHAHRDAESVRDQTLASPSPPPTPTPQGRKKEHAHAPRRRTQPYAAPYFVAPPDRPDVVEPLTRPPRRYLSRRRTMPPPARMAGLAVATFEEAS
ncbi:hypothetical protein GGX14DRAFT_678165 [Mycena pura]|uniref:Uncharacterized protein n=1 Tax=Mycena pura TaxID=153505 RepID=A0AAD6UVN4_9AGAR|nr:hypothetical protein GGX14DRAFT_678165 [Mycena pura]